MMNNSYRTFSRFARDPDVYLYLVETILFTLAKNSSSVLRVWSVGCAGGEEPYSVAIAWHCALASEFPHVKLEILATDVECLDRAKEAVYDAYSVANLPVEWIARCFDVVGESYALRPELKDAVNFVRADASEFLPEETFSLISCRYSVYLYLPAPSRWTITRRLATILRADGFLVTGLSDKLPQGYESLGFCPYAKGFYGLRDDISLSSLSQGSTKERSKTTSFVSSRSRELLRQREELLKTKSCQRKVDTLQENNTEIRRKRANSNVQVVDFASRRKRTVLPVPDVAKPPLAIGDKSEERISLVDRYTASLSLSTEEEEEEGTCVPSLVLSKRESESLIKRLMADVVRRQQEFAAMDGERNETAKMMNKEKKKLTARGLGAFLDRVSRDIERRKESLSQLLSQSTLSNEKVRSEEQVGLDGLRLLARRKPLTAKNDSISITVRPNRLVRYFLKNAPPSRGRSVSMAADKYYAGDQNKKLVASSPRAAASRGPVPAQRSGAAKNSRVMKLSKVCLGAAAVV